MIYLNRKVVKVIDIETKEIYFISNSAFKKSTDKYVEYSKYEEQIKKAKRKPRKKKELEE